MEKEILTAKELEILVSELLNSDALEISAPDPQSMELLIPYMMNDAVEYYLRLTRCRIQGEWQKEVSGELRCPIIREKDRFGILLRQEDGNAVSIWYQEAYFEKHCYQYHRIGHQWRREKGEEHWRRLVNLLCVLHDKYTYLGEDACNELELQLYPLIEFAPLCFWTPINDRISAWYPETEKGIQSMLALTKEAGDASYEKLVKRYLSTDSQKKNHEKKIRELALELLKPEHACLFWTLQNKIEKASLYWEERTYSDMELERMEKLRKETEQIWKKKGYEGSYPFLYCETQKRTIFFVEEHPFTVLESDEYQFQIYRCEVPDMKKDAMI